MSFQCSIHESTVKLTFYLLHFNSQSFCSAEKSTPAAPQEGSRSMELKENKEVSSSRCWQHHQSSTPAASFLMCGTESKMKIPQSLHFIDHPEAMGGSFWDIFKGIPASFLLFSSKRSPCPARSSVGNLTLFNLTFNSTPKLFGLPEQK